MTQLSENAQLHLGQRRAHGRMANAMADLLRRQLYVPNVYLNPKIAGVAPIDVLAADRAGSGDLHAIEVKILVIFPTRSQLRTWLKPLKSLPFHYKYLAVPGFSPDLDDSRRFADYPELFDESGIGRVGIISFDHRILMDSTALDSKLAVLTVKPERFLVRGEKLEAVEKFLSKAKPDMEVRI